MNDTTFSMLGTRSLATVRYCQMASRITSAISCTTHGLRSTLRGAERLLSPAGRRSPTGRVGSSWNPLAKVVGSLGLGGAWGLWVTSVMGHTASVNGGRYAVRPCSRRSIWRKTRFSKMSITAMNSTVQAIMPRTS